MKIMIPSPFGLCRYEESEKNYKKFLELNPGHSAAEKQLSQLSQSQSAWESASNLFETGELTKALEYLEKVVLVFSPACAKVKTSICFVLITFIYLISNLFQCEGNKQT